MVSVVVPCYNCEQTLGRCINSIRRQTQTKLEIVLVDDGSEDKTGELCNTAAVEDMRVKVVHQENKGLMNAWKRGVEEAQGEFIAFCDADDYMDNNMIEVMESKAVRYQADIVFAGMVQEYPDGTKRYADNRLQEGFYKKGDIQNKVLPSYFSCGKMQSHIVLASRCVKLFRRALLSENFKYLNDRISVGEDDLTSFASVLAADSVYCMNGFFPYHYVKNRDSMIGKHDRNMFQKFLDLRRQMYLVAEAYSYGYSEQIDAGFLSNAFLCMKKEISRNKGENYKGIKLRLTKMRENAVLDKIINKCDISGYDLTGRIFAFLIIKKQYFAVYLVTKLGDALGMGKA